MIGVQTKVVLYDSCGRPTLNLRVSLTQRCNLRCPYCHREGQIPTTSSVGLREMTGQEVIRLVKIAVELGINRVKLTGGEPLLRNDIVEIVSGLAEIEGLRDLSMTSNGTHLAELAKPLHEAGLKRININLPSLNKKTYAELNGGDLNDAWASPFLAEIRGWQSRLSLEKCVLLLEDGPHRSHRDTIH